MDETHPYKGQRITVWAIACEFDKAKWEPRISITGAVQSLNFNTKNPRKCFDTDKEAIEYGLAAAQWIIDHPAQLSNRKIPIGK